MKRSEYIWMLVFFILAVGYGIYTKTDITSILATIIGGGFISKASTDFGKNSKKNDQKLMIGGE